MVRECKATIAVRLDEVADETGRLVPTTRAARQEASREISKARRSLGEAWLGAHLVHGEAAITEGFLPPDRPVSCSVMIDVGTIAMIAQQLGLGVGGNAIYDALRAYFASDPHPTREKLAQCLRSNITVDRQDVWAEELIELLAAHGDLVITGSEIRAPGLSMAAENGGTIAVEHGSRVHGGGVRIESQPDGRLTMGSAPGGRVVIEGGQGRLRFKA